MKHPLSFRQDRLQGRTAGFTLVEMLAVTTIIGLLTVLTVLGVHGIDNSTSRKAAVGTLMGVFDQARMLAVSDGRPTYVVFASAPRSQTQDTSAADPALWGRAYALFEDPALTDNSNAASFSPVQLSAWMYLPIGVAFKSDNSDGSPDSVTAYATPSDTTKFQVRCSAGPSKPLTLPYVKFDAQGQVIDYTGEIVLASSPSLRVLLFDGASSSTGVETSTNRAAAVSGTKLKYALDEIDLKPTTGRAQYNLNPIYNLAVAATPSP